jgi:hypothetical protein
MLQYIIGALLILGGAALSFFVPRKINSRNIEIKFMQTTPIGELKALLDHNEKEGLQGYRHYVEVKGSAGSDSPEETPYSKRDVAYYQSYLYQVYEEVHTFRDDKGRTRRQVVKKESEMASQKSSNPITINDRQTGDKVYLDVSQSGLKLETLKTLDRFEPVNNMKKYDFFSGIRFSNMGSRTLGFRMLEKTIPLGRQLYLLGEAWLEGNRIQMGKPGEKDKPFIVSVRSEEDIVQSNAKNSRAALIIGILIAVAGIAVMIFLR